MCEKISSYASLKAAVKSGDQDGLECALKALFREDWNRTANLIVGGNRDFKGGLARDKLRGGQKLFWLSNIPRTLGWELATNERLGDKFVKAWLSQCESPVSELVQTGMKEDPPKLIEILKRHRIPFQHRSRWESLLPILRACADEGVQEFLREVDMLGELRSNACNQLARHEYLLRNQRHPEIIVIHFALWLEKCYLEFTGSVPFEVIARQSSESLQIALDRHRLLVPEPEWLETKTEVERRVDEAFQRLSKGGQWDFPALFSACETLATVDYLIDMFCLQGWRVSARDETVVTVGPPDAISWKQWKYNERKYQLFHTYCEIPQTEPDYRLMSYYKEQAPNAVSEKAYWDTEVTTRYLLRALGEIDTCLGKNRERCLNGTLAINSLTCLAQCYRAQFHDLMGELRRLTDPPEVILGKRMKREMARRLVEGGACPRSPVEPRTRKQMSGIVEQQLPDIFSDEEFSDIIDLVSYDISKPGDAGLLYASLLLKTPNLLLLLPRLFCTDIKSVLLTRVMKKNVNNNKPYSEWQEQRIGNLFKQHGFGVNLNPKSSSNANELCDILAYKEGILFAVETKLTYPRVTIRQVAGHASSLEKGVRQLKMACESIPYEYSLIAKSLDIQEDIKDLTVVPLLVSTLPEQDGAIDPDVLKVSLFELELLLDGHLPMFAEYVKSKQMVMDKLSPDEQSALQEGMADHSLEQRFNDAAKKVLLDEAAMNSIVPDSQLMSETPAPASEILQALSERRVWQVLLGPVEGTEDARYVTLKIGEGKSVQYAS